MKVIRIILAEETNIAHFPNGTVKFLSLFQLLKLMWWAVRNNVNMTFED